MIVELLKFIRETLKIPFRATCHVVKIAYSTFMRWKERARRGAPTVLHRGPKKVEPFELGQLEEEVAGLHHCRKRTHGTGELYEQYRESVSRRYLQELVKTVRDEVNAKERQEQRRVEWKVPGSVWSMDDTEVGLDKGGRKRYVHTLKDVASQYRFPPISGDFFKGQGVAENLESVIKEHGPPLVLKQDNGSNLNHADVQGVLLKRMVIPLNNPPGYPQYNGSVERSQRELKEALHEKLGGFHSLPGKHLGPYVEAVVNELNHRPRRILRGQTACHVFFSQKGGLKFNRRQRRSIFDWIKGLFYVILNALGEDSKRSCEASWRIAVETWLQMNGIIEVTVNGKVLVRQAKLDASCKVKVFAGKGLTSHSYRVLQL